MAFDVDGMSLGVKTPSKIQASNTEAHLTLIEFRESVITEQRVVGFRA